MLKKYLLLVISCLMVLSLVIASCTSDTDTGGKVTEVDKGQTVVVSGDDDDGDVGTSGPITTVTADPDKPKYGGTLVILASSDIQYWNPGAVAGQGAGQGGYAIEQILGVDFTAGPAGRGETNYIGGIADYRYLGGNIAESWETPEAGVWVLNIRQGIHFYNHPDQAASKLVGGRELTAEDVAYSIEYMRDNPTSSTNFSEPTLIKNATVERTGPWQITLYTPVSPCTTYLWILGGGGVQYVWPKEFLEQYATSNNWYDVVGTGPYIIDDYVPGSVGRYIRNPNYWDTNPIGAGKGDQLPYPDALNYQIIPDASTRLAAMRTGRADWSAVDTLEREDFQSITRTNPDMKYAQTIIAPQQVAGRITDPNNPFSKKEVRHAMMLAINHPEIVNDFYRGEAEFLDSPARKWYTTIYTPLEEQNAIVQELYGYNPEKAKQLLAQAGYPDGFKLKIEMLNSPASETAFSIIKEYWADVGIEIEPVLLESSVFFGVWVNRSYQDLFLSAFPGGDGSLFVRYSMGYFRGPNIFNLSFVNDPIGSDPIIEHAFDVQSQTVGVDYAAADAITKETWKYVLEQAFLIPMPAPWGYRIWQPWLRNYYGANDVKFWLRWAWIDQDMKFDMTGRR